MKRKVRITETQLNTIIKKALKEQQDDQIMGTGPSPEEVTGSPEGEETGEPDFEAFVSSGKELMSQGITLGNLIDKLNETEEEPEPESGEPSEVEPDQSIPSDNQ